MNRLVFALTLVGFASQANAAMTPAEAVQLAQWGIKKFNHTSDDDRSRVYAACILMGCDEFGEELTVKVFKTVGPQVFLHWSAFNGMEERTAYMQFLGRHGADGFAILNERNSRFILLGPDAQTVLVKHGDAFLPILQANDVDCIRALAVISTDSARHVLHLLTDLQAHVGDSTHHLLRWWLLDSIARYREKAVTYCWHHRDLITRKSGLTCFGLSPSRYLSGERDLAKDTLELELENKAQMQKLEKTTAPGQ